MHKNTLKSTFEQRLKNQNQQQTQRDFKFQI
jgi:hypothetical protein